MGALFSYALTHQHLTQVCDTEGHLTCAAHFAAMISCLSAFSKDLSNVQQRVPVPELAAPSVPRALHCDAWLSQALTCTISEASGPPRGDGLCCQGDSWIDRELNWMFSEILSNSEIERDLVQNQDTEGAGHGL